MESQLNNHITFSLNTKQTSTLLSVVAFVLLSLLINTTSVQAYEDGWTLSIPSQDINAPIVPVYIRDFGNNVITWDFSSLRMQVGHLDATSWFGENGTVILGGHSVISANQPDVFVHLDDVVVGDTIIVSGGGAERHYQVTDVRSISQNDLSMFNPVAGERLILFTCDTRTYDAASRTYSGRVMVVAVPS